MTKEWLSVENPWGYHGEWSPSGGPAAKNPRGLRSIGFWLWDLPRDIVLLYTAQVLEIVLRGDQAPCSARWRWFRTLPTRINSTRIHPARVHPARVHHARPQPAQWSWSRTHRTKKKLSPLMKVTTQELPLKPKQKHSTKNQSKASTRYNSVYVITSNKTIQVTTQELTV